ncbi:Uu.00g055550.m01.CDS01 [Anthostomella pinea]|uniref:Uu.00g055550.m01.CDS01 n=1 Tax=Anthostomella pinea TaxID=933095 RepID=A0AAI8VXR1_9PEZI|nr:Uu.00g055550.m01.CDS01 [Anthostomella pinea]
MGFPRGCHKFYVFGIFDIDQQMYLRADLTFDICKKLGWDHAPIIKHQTTLNDFAKNIDEHDLVEMLVPTTNPLVWEP